MIDESRLFQLMHAQLAHVNRLTGELHLTNDGTDYLIGAMRLGADLTEAWLADNFVRANEILTEDYLLAHYACDGVVGFVWKYAERVAPSTSMTAHEARELLLAGERIRVVVGVKPGDPTLVISREDNMIISESIAGWTAGVVEPVCRVDTESHFLLTFLSGRAHLYRHDVEQGEST